MRVFKEYAIYKGEELLFMGTMRECAEFLGVKYETAIFYNCSAYKRRIEKRQKARNYTVLVCMDSDDD